MKSWINFVLKYPKTIIAFCILTTVLMGWNIPKLVIDPDVKSMMPQENYIIRSISEIEDTFGGSELVIVSISSDDIFSRRTLQKVRSLTSEIEDLDIVDRVISLWNAVDIKGTIDGFEVYDLIEDFPETEEERNALRMKIKENELIYGDLVSKDFNHTSIVAILSVSSVATDDEEVFRTFNELRSRYEGPEEIHLAGFPLTRREIVKTMQSDMKTLFPYGIALMIILLVFSFRSWAGAFLPFIVVIMSIIDTLGLMAILKIKFVFINVLLPVMLIAIANDYSIHIIAHYFEEYKNSVYKNKDDLLSSTLSHLKTPVFLAGITTLIGFLSLQSHILPPARHMGLLASFGITIAFILSVTFVPAALIVLDFPVFLRKGGKTERMDNFLTKWGQFFVKYRIAFLVLAILSVAVLAIGIPRVVVDTNPMHYFRKSAEIRNSNDIIDKYFGGSAQLSIMANGDIKDPAFLKKIEKLSEFLEGQQIVTRTISIVDQLKVMNRAFHSDSVVYETIPTSREAIAQYLLLYSLTGNPEDLDRFVDYDYSQAQIIARVNEMSSTSAHKLFNDTESYIESELDKENFPSVTGMVAVVGVLLDMVVKGQIRSLVVSIILVFLITAIIFRSIVAGLLSIVPLSSAVIIVFGLMGYVGIELNIATAMLSSIMIGVGIDYTIHFLYRYRLEIKRRLRAGDAVIRTLTTSGKGIIYNALSVIVGFSVLMVSGFLPIYFFGFLIVFSITACLVGALTVMPALLVCIRPVFIFGKKESKR